MTEIDRYGQPVERVHPERPAPVRPLTSDEVKKIIDLVVAYTRRDPDASMVEVWAVQSALGRWTYPEAARAIHLWGKDRQPGAFLEPSDVTRAIRAERQDRALREENARLTAPGDPVAAERLKQIVSGIAADMGWTDTDDRPRSSTALQVRCPHCGAAENVRCVNPSTGKPLRNSPAHPSRTDALADFMRGRAS